MTHSRAQMESIANKVRNKVTTRPPQRRRSLLRKFVHVNTIQHQDRLEIGSVRSWQQQGHDITHYLQICFTGEESSPVQILCENMAGMNI